MAGNRTSFTKRQKERARQEKQAEKAQRKAQRKQETNDEPGAPTQPAGEIVIAHDEEGQPLPLDFHDFK